MAETQVRMGELAASAAAGDVLVSLGLGSCIGLALLDRRTGVAGLAHVVLPDSGGNAADNMLKFADQAVPELVERVVAKGGRRLRLEAALVGGASMFATSSATLEVGQRNEAAVREQLKALRIPVIAAETGGKRGRTIRVHVDATKVTVREAGGKDHDLVAPRAGVAA
jgi:chemotaxis protein CheD